MGLGVKSRGEKRRPIGAKLKRVSRIEDIKDEEESYSIVLKGFY